MILWIEFLANTVQGFSQYVAKINPDLIIVHGDRVEALAGAIVGSLNNILLLILKVVKFQEP